MKLKSPLAGVLLAASLALSLTACGGGDDDAGSHVVVANPASFTKTDTTVGTCAEATSGKTATVTYTGWLYSTTATGNKGTQLIAGFDQGVQGMKVGGKRTVLVPSNLGYGSTGNSQGTVRIPPNAGLVFDIALTAVK